jgi:hypothetical protein
LESVREIDSEKGTVWSCHGDPGFAIDFLGSPSERGWAPEREGELFVG